MAKINNREIYDNIDFPSLLDFLLGTKEADGKTKSFPLQSVIQLINGVNGKNNIQFEFSDGTNPEIDYLSSGNFFTNTNTTEVGTFTQLIFNKETVYPLDLSVLFNKLGELEDVVIKLENPEDPNNFFNFKIVSFTDNLDYFTFGVQDFNEFYLGELINKKIYSLYFDIKESTTDLSDYYDKSETDTLLSYKLDTVDYNDRFKGVFPSESALNIAHPTSNPGDYAQVNEVGSVNVVNYNWDDEEAVWVEAGSAGSGATNTDMLPEGSSNLYFTTARLFAALLTGISFITGGAIVPTDSVLVAFGKLQKQINDILSAIGLKSDIRIETKSVWVSATGVDASGLVGRQDKPFLTINAALDALGVNGGIVNIGLGSFNSPSYLKIYPNTTFKGSGKPDYNNSITGGASYPLYTKTTATALVGGTILLGTFRIPLGDNYQIYDLGVDAGPDWCASFNGNVAAECFMISNAVPPSNTAQSGKLMRKNVIIKNISTIVKAPTDLVHSFNIENCFEPYLDNISTYNGFAGFVYKNIGGTATNIKASNSGSYGIILKTNSYAYGNSVLLDGFEIDGGGGLTIHDEDTGVQNIYVQNGRIRNCTYGIKQLGVQLKYINISNVYCTSITGFGFEFTNLEFSNLLNNNALSCGSGGFKVIGTNNRLSENRAVSNTGVGIEVRTSSSTYPTVLTGNDSSDNTTYGFLYSGNIQGGHNIARGNTTAPSTGTITLIDVPVPLTLTGAPGGFSSVLSVENTGISSSADKNVASFIGNRGSATSIDDNTSVNIAQKNNTVKNYSVIGFFNASFNTVAQIAIRNISHGASEGSIGFVVAKSNALSLAGVFSSNGNLLLGKDQFTGATNNDNDQKLQVEGITYLKEYTVNALPTPTGGKTSYATVTDATSPTYLGTLTGGGSVKCPVFYNGSVWVAH